MKKHLVCIFVLVILLFACMSLQFAVAESSFDGVLKIKNESFLKMRDQQIEEIQWSIRDAGTLSIFDQALLKEYNTKSQIVVYARQNGKPYVWAFFDPLLGLFTIPTPQTQNGWRVEWLRVNGNGLVIGWCPRPAPKVHNGFFYDLTTWSPKQGLKVYPAQFENGIKLEKQDFLARCMNSDLVVVNRISDNSENNQVLVLENNVLKNITPELCQHARLLGFDAGGWLISDVNSQGMMRGQFFLYKMHPYKNKKLKVTRCFFMKDGENFHIVNSVNLPADIDVGYISSMLPPHSFDLNGRILTSYFGVEKNQDPEIWSPEDGLKVLKPPSCIMELTEKGGALPPKAMGLLDDGTILWLISYNGSVPESEQPLRGCIFEKDGNYRFLSLNSKGEPAFKNSDDYPGLDMNHSRCPLIKDEGEVFEMKFLGETHPFIIERA